MNNIVIIALILLAGLFASILLLLFKRHQGKPIPFAVILVLTLMAGALATTVVFVQRGEDYQAYQSLKWHTLAPERIAPLVAQGYTVFVDITADWCMVCQANKADVTHREQVVRRLNADNIILMQGNWSEEDALIAAYMRHEGVPGTPYNKIYGPGAPNGIVLPSTLTIADVINGLTKASSAPHTL